MSHVPPRSPSPSSDEEPPAAVPEAVQPAPPEPASLEPELPEPVSPLPPEEVTPQAAAIEDPIRPNTVSGVANTFTF